MREIRRRRELIELSKELRVRDSWHEADEQGLTVEIRGDHLDNAGFWGLKDEAWQLERGHTSPHMEYYVIIRRGESVMGEVNLATLFAWATGYIGEG